MSPGVRTSLLSLLIAGTLVCGAAAQSRGIDGRWTRGDGTTVDFVERDGKVEGRIRTPSAQAAGTFGWTSGELFLEATRDADTLTGKRHYRFPVSYAQQCPSARGGSGILELKVVSDTVMEGRWQNSLLQSDCRVTTGAWAPDEYRREAAARADAGGVVEAPAGGTAPIDLDRLTETDLDTMCADCLEQAADFIALKDNYPRVKQRWLDLTERRRAVADDVKRGRMEAELRELDAALKPPPPADFSVADYYAGLLRAGWRRHALALDQSLGTRIEGQKELLRYLTGSTLDGWLIEREYDPEVGASLSASDREALAAEGAAQRKLDSQLRRRQRFLEQQLALHDQLTREAGQAEAAVDALEAEILRAGVALRACLKACRR